jgi:hypothetical protein
VLKNRIMVGIASASAVLIPVGGAAIATHAPAGATPPGISCKKLSGTFNTGTNTSTSKFSKCTGNTGTKGTSSGGASPDMTATVVWANHKTTKFSEVANSLATGAPDPCPSTDLAEVLTGKVKSDTTGDTVKKAHVNAIACVVLNTSSTTSAVTGTESLAPGTKFTIAG